MHSAQCKQLATSRILLRCCDHKQAKAPAGQWHHVFIQPTGSVDYALQYFLVSNIFYVQRNKNLNCPRDCGQFVVGGSQSLCPKFGYRLSDTGTNQTITDVVYN